MEVCVENDTYCGFVWGNPEDDYPWENNPYYVMASTPDDRDCSFQVGEALAKKINYEGKVFMVGGDLSSDTALNRYEGARAAFDQYPNYVGTGFRRTKAAMAIARTCYETLLEDGLKARIAAEHGLITEAVENIIEANTLLSGLGFENTGCAGGHAISEGLGVLEEGHHLYHGEKVAFGTVCMLMLENRPAEELLEVIHFCLDVGLPITFKDLGIEPTRENLLKIAERSVSDKGAMASEPMFVSQEMVYDALIATDAYVTLRRRSTSMGSRFPRTLTPALRIQ